MAHNANMCICSALNQQGQSPAARSFACGRPALSARSIRRITKSPNETKREEKSEPYGQN